jgi:adenylate cyclase
MACREEQIELNRGGSFAEVCTPEILAARVGRDAQGSSTSRRPAVIYLSSHVPVPRCLEEPTDGATNYSSITDRSLRTSAPGEQQVKNIARPVHVYRVRDRAVPVEQSLAASTQPLPLPDKPSVAVLPFTDMSTDSEQEFFADGIAEDIITALSRYPSLFVIARNSCFTYKGRAVDVKQVGRELGVRYVLEGSLRKSGNRIRVTAQLVEAETGKHVWSERYDRDLAAIFAVQDEITGAVTIAITPAKFFQRAIDLDPIFVGGYTGLAAAMNRAGVMFLTGNLAEALSAEEALARRAVALDGDNAEARSRLAIALQSRGDYQGGQAEAERALAISPNLADAHGALGVVLTFSGRPEEGLAALKTCVRLDPRAPSLDHMSA